MPRKASGELKVKSVERPQPNGDIYIYEVTTLYNPQKRYNEHVSSRLLGKKSPDGTGIVPTRPRKSAKTGHAAAIRELAKTGRWMGGITPTGYGLESIKNVTVDGKAKRRVSKT